MESPMRQEVREYLRATVKIFGLSFQDNALTDAERDAIVSYAQELEKKLLPSPLANDPASHRLFPR
jgi:hypothetical protein